MPQPGYLLCRILVVAALTSAALLVFVGDITAASRTVYAHYRKQPLQVSRTAAQHVSDAASTGCARLCSDCVARVPHVHRKLVCGLSSSS
jgi:hypothetical protein